MRYSTFHIYSNSRQYIFTLVLLAVLVLSVVGAGGIQPGSSQSDLANQKAVLCSLEDSFNAIAEQVGPGVVSITAVQRVVQEEQTGLDEFFKRFYEGNSDESFGSAPGHSFYLIQSTPTPVTASGSGTIVRHEGQYYYILTNNHVVEGAYKVQVTLRDETQLDGIVVGTDSVTDLAVVRVASPKLSDADVVPMGDSNAVKVGSWALAVGNPFGFEHTLTVGVISAVQRELEEDDIIYPDLIQTDAAINKGNSGGPLIDVEGRVIGVNAAIASPTGGFVGLGFAIPINTAKSVLDQLIRDGRVVRGWLGVGSQELIPEFQEYYGVQKGVLVCSVIDGSPAKKAGLAEEDIIAKVGQTDIEEVLQLQRLVAGIKPGTPTLLTVIRQGEPHEIQVQIGLSPTTPAGPPQPIPVKQGPGIQVRTLSSDLAKKIGYEGLEGVIVIDILAGGPAENSGLAEGDIVTHFNGRKVVNEGQFAGMLKGMQEGKVVVLRILRKGMPRLIGFRMDSA